MRLQPRAARSPGPCCSTPAAAPCQRLRGLAARRRPHPVPSALTGNSEEFEGVEGNPNLQDALLQQLRVQIESQTLKEEIKEDLRGKVDGIRQISDEMLSQLDEELGIEKFRTELESSQVLSEANDKFNELEEQVQKIKDQIKADEADLRAFEASSAAARSQGLFFRSLYKPPGDEEGEQQAGQPSSSSGAGASTLVDPAAARAAAAVVASSAEEEVSRPFRFYLFSAMAAVLVLVVGQDLCTAQPKLALDGLYGVLAGLLGVNAFNERRVLLELLQQQRQAAADASTSSKDGGTT